MLCWLAGGDHEALGRDMPRASTITLTLKKKQQFLLESTPRIAMISPSSSLPWEAQMLSRLAFGDHEALGRDMPRASTITLT